MMRRFSAILGALTLLPSTAFSQTADAAGIAAPVVQLHLDHVWTMMAAALVLLMQVGFMLLEAGSVRSKNAINVAQKNLMDFLISTTLFALIGFPLMFGASTGGWFGWSPDLFFFGVANDWDLTFFVFQMMFCGTAATIVSGAVAERMTMTCYLMLVALIGALIYPIAGHWAWGGLLTGDADPFLARLGFMDFAGSTVVHSVGAWVALAAAIQVGPRRGRYGACGKPVELHGHSPVLATSGALLIWVGWIGFNGGSTTAGTPAFAGIIANTMVAGSMGGLAAGLLGFVQSGYHRPEFAVNGVLAGLVGITAGCDVVSLQSAAVIGVFAAGVAHILRQKLTDAGVDDPVGAISVHGAAGVFGTVALALFAPTETLLAGGRIAQIGVQLLGVSVFFVWTFGIAWVALALLDRALRPEGGPRGTGLRVPQSSEVFGLNETEHRTPLGINRLTTAMQAIADNDREDIAPLVLDPGDETYEAGTLFNQILARQNAIKAEDAARQRDLSDILDRVQKVVGAVAGGNLSARVHGDAGDFKSLIDEMNALLETMSDVVRQSADAAAKAQSSAASMRTQAAGSEETARRQSDRVDSLHATLADLRARILNSNAALRTVLTTVGEAAVTNTEARDASGVMIDKIAKSTKIISTIGTSIDTIDHIALQTHILSMNASVEATRAQSGGSAGFTVVATEIRALAGQSAQTAKTIRALIKDVQTRSNDAEAQVAVTDGALGNLITSNEAISETVQDLDAINQDILESLSAVSDTINTLQSDASHVLSDAARSDAMAAELLNDAEAAAETTRHFRWEDAKSPDRAA